MSSEWILLLFNYIILPFISSLIFSLCLIECYRRLKLRNFFRHITSLSISDLEKQTKIQGDKIVMISEQFSGVYEKIGKTDDRMSEIYDSIKILEEKLQLMGDQSIKSHIFETSPILKHEHTPINKMSPQNHDNRLQNQIQLNYEDDIHRNGTIEYILKKLENTSLTTKEIQLMIGRTREHTSRLMKKLYEEDLVVRDIAAKPFRYTITNEGRKRLSEHSALKIHSRLGH